MKAGASVRMWMQRELGFILPVFWGPKWWCPLLPDPSVELHTVIGKPIQLPWIESPSVEEVAKWHQIYCDNIEAIYERYKARFGQSSRKLEIL